MVAGFRQGHARALCPAPASAFGADVAPAVFRRVKEARGKCGGLHVDLIKRLFSFHIFFSPLWERFVFYFWRSLWDFGKRRRGGWKPRRKPFLERLKRIRGYFPLKMQ
jgi:hypothetical protein